MAAVIVCVSPVMAQADWIGEGGVPEALLGWSAEGAGDVNGDGYADLVGGAPVYTDGETYEGAAYLYVDDDEVGLDTDMDGTHNACDNCPSAFNTGQADGEGGSFQDWAWAAVASRGES